MTRHQPPIDEGPTPGKNASSRSEASQTPEEILAYWTPERMAEAVPRDIRLPDPEETEEN
jgi:hypothetical protein